MSRWIRLLLPLLVLLAIAIGIWTWLFPSPRAAIMRRLAEVARAASFNTNEGTLAKFQNNQKLVACCTPDVEIIVEVYGQRRVCNGKEELFEKLTFARTQVLGSLSVQFHNPVITLSPNKQTAFADLTVEAKSSNDPELLVQECNFTFQKVGRSWLIRKIEPVKTLR